MGTATSQLWIIQALQWITGIGKEFKLTDIQKSSPKHLQAEAQQWGISASHLWLPFQILQRLRFHVKITAWLGLFARPCHGFLCTWRPASTFTSWIQSAGSLWQKWLFRGRSAGVTLLLQVSPPPAAAQPRKGDSLSLSSPSVGHPPQPAIDEGMKPRATDHSLSSYMPFPVPFTPESLHYPSPPSPRRLPSRLWGDPCPGSPLRYPPPERCLPLPSPPPQDWPRPAARAGSWLRAPPRPSQSARGVRAAARARTNQTAASCGGPEAPPRAPGAEASRLPVTEMAAPAARQASGPAGSARHGGWVRAGRRGRAGLRPSRKRGRRSPLRLGAARHKGGGLRQSPRRSCNPAALLPAARRSIT